MPNWSRSSLFEPVPGDTGPVPVYLKRDYRLPLPVEVRRAVEWLATGSEKQEVLFELADPGRVRVIEAGAALPLLQAAMAESARTAEDLRLIYSRGSFIRDRLDLSDPVVPHLGILHEIGREEMVVMFVRAYAGDIEIWSKGFHDEQLALAQERQRDVIESLRRGGF
jgi:hypothetical protein